MSRILVLALGHLSNGELTIAMECLRQLDPAGHEVRFVSHENGSSYIRSWGLAVEALSHPNPADNRAAFLELVSAWRPDLLLCADVYTMEYASAWSGIDFALLRSLGPPVASMDEYEWESTDFVWDYMGSVPTRIRPELIRDCDILVRPVPLNRPAAPTTRIAPCRLFDPRDRRPQRTRSQWLADLGIPAEGKIVFTVNSGWEYINISPHPEVAALIEWMPRLMHELLSGAADGPVTVVHVGPRPWSFPTAPHVAYRYFARLDAGLYRDTACHADLFCGTNSTSITMSSAIAAGTPAVLLLNLKRIRFADLGEVLQRMPAWYREMAGAVSSSFPYRIFPWGLAKFLKVVLDANPYAATFVEAPLFVPAKSTRAIRSLLYDDGAIADLRARQEDYVRRLEDLTPLDEFFARLP